MTARSNEKQRIKNHEYVQSKSRPLKNDAILKLIWSQPTSNFVFNEIAKFLKKFNNIFERLNSSGND